MTSAQYEARLRPRLTSEFLETLAEAARVVGWSVDSVEVNRFYKTLADMAGVYADPDGLDTIPYEVVDPEYYNDEKEK